MLEARNSHNIRILRTDGGDDDVPASKSEIVYDGVFGKLLRRPTVNDVIAYLEELNEGYKPSVPRALNAALKDDAMPQVNLSLQRNQIVPWMALRKAHPSPLDCLGGFGAVPHGWAVYQCMGE